DQVDKEVAQHIIKLISKADKFSWVYHKSRVDDISNRQDTMSRIDRYECNGTIQINIEHAYNLAIVNIYHYLHSPPEMMDFSISIRNYIIENNLLTVPQLYENIKN
ncbi:8592_t:CDS:2, partial [Racocetra persica]